MSDFVLLVFVKGHSTYFNMIFIHRQPSGSAWPCSCRLPSVLLRLAVTMAFVATTQRSLNRPNFSRQPKRRLASQKNFLSGILNVLNNTTNTFIVCI